MKSIDQSSHRGEQQSDLAKNPHDGVPLFVSSQPPWRSTRPQESGQIIRWSPEKHGESWQLSPAPLAWLKGIRGSEGPQSPEQVWHPADS